MLMCTPDVYVAVCTRCDGSYCNRTALLQDVAVALPPAQAGKRCSVVQDALHDISPEFATLVDRVIPLVRSPHKEQFTITSKQLAACLLHSTILVGSIREPLIVSRSVLSRRVLPWVFAWPTLPTDTQTIANVRGSKMRSHHPTTPHQPLLWQNRFSPTH